MFKNEYLKSAELIGLELLNSSQEINGIKTWPDLEDINESYNRSIFDILKGQLGNLLFLSNLSKFSAIKEFKTFTINNSQCLIDKIKSKQLMFNDFFEVINYGYFLFNLGTVYRNNNLIKLGLNTILKNTELKHSNVLDSYWGAGRELALLLSIYKSSKNISIAKIIFNYLPTIFDNLDYNPRGMFLKPLQIKPAPLLGFAHGSSGIAWILGELYNSFKVRELKSMIHHIYMYEDSWYNIETLQNNFNILKNDNWEARRTNSWCDFRYLKFPVHNNKESIVSEYLDNKLKIYNEIRLSHPIAFCNGNSGILAGRIKTQFNLNDINGLKKTKNILDMGMKFDVSPNNNIYSICCGLGGVTETYLLAYQIFKDKKYLEFCKSIADSCIKHYYKTKKWKSVDDNGMAEEVILNNIEKFKYTVFKGITGIGYFLLRLYEKDNCSSILMPTSHSLYKRVRVIKLVVKGYNFNEVRYKLIIKYWQFSIQFFNKVYKTDILNEYIRESKNFTPENEIIRFKKFFEDRIKFISSKNYKKIFTKLIHMEYYRFNFQIRNPIIIDRYFEYFICNYSGKLLSKSILTIQKDVKLFNIPQLKVSYIFFVDQFNQPKIIALDSFKKRIIILLKKYNTLRLLNKILFQSHYTLISNRIKLKNALLELLNLNIIHLTPVVKSNAVVKL